MKRLQTPDISIFLDPLQESMDEQSKHLESWAGILREYSGNPEYYDGDTLNQIDQAMTEATDRPWINYLSATANTIVPNLLAREPHIIVAPNRPEFVDKAKAQEAAANALASRVGVLSVVQETLVDSLLFGVGITKVGWDDSDAGAITTPDYEDGDEGAIESDDPLDQLPSDRAEHIRRVLAENDIPATYDPQLPTVRRVAPWDFLIATGAASPAESPWVAERILITDDDLRAVPFFKIPSTAQPDTQLIQGPINPGSDGSSQYSSGTPTHHTVWEIHYWHTGRKGRQRRTIWIRTSPQGIDSATVLAHIVDPAKTSGWPYEYLQSQGAPGTWYRTQTADLAAIRGLATRLNDEWSYILKHHRLSSKRKYLYGAGINPEDLANLLGSEQDMVATQANTEDVGNSIAIVPEAPPPSDTGTVLQGLRSMIYEVSGIDAFQRGALPSNTTATAASLANQSTQGRLIYRLQKVEAYYARVVRRIMGYYAQFARDDLIVRIAGPNGPTFVTHTPGSYGPNDYDITLELGSAMPRDPRSQQQSYMSLLSAISSTVQALAPAVQAGAMPPEALKGFVDRAFDVWKEDPGFFEGPLGELAGGLMTARGPQPQGPQGPQDPQGPQPQGPQDPQGPPQMPPLDQTPNS